MSFPLAGLRVLDFGQGIAGPYSAQLLGDHGAEVIKVEPPRGDWSRTMGAQDGSGLSGSFISVNRNKRCICLDLKQAAAIAVARTLALKADVVIESFRPGVMDRFGLGSESLRGENPRLVYCDVTGFGPSGPNVDLPASDSVMQPYGGLMSINGERGGDPLRVGNVVSDMIAGANAFSGIMVALFARATSGEGRRVSVSLLDSIVAFQAGPITEYLVTGNVPQRLGNDHPMTTPSGVFRTKDGAISFTVMEHMWPKFCEGLGVSQLINDVRFANGGLRQQNRDVLRQALASVLMSRSSTEWISLFRGMDILCAPINDYPALVHDAQVQHNGILQAVRTPDGRSIPMLRNPVRIEDEPMRFSAPPRVGEHTREVLLELGLSPAQIEEAFSSKAVLGTSH